MADNKVIIAVAVVAVVAVAAVAIFFVMNNGSSNDDEPFYFYIDFGDNDTKTGWYTATGKNTDDALAKAVDGKGITITYSKYGYPNFDSGTWGVFAYTWKQVTTTTADESIKSPSYGAYDDFLKSNGWISYSGYGDAAKKMDQSQSNIFYFAKYDPETYAIKDPTTSTLWKNASGSPFVKGVEPTYDYKYYFYIYFGDNNEKTGWYSASGKNTDDALAKAIDGKGITLTYSKYGYPNFDSSTWGVFAYDWYDCTATTADESVKSPSYGAWGDFIKSNGWISFAGYGDAAKKMNQSNSAVFFFSAYDESYDLVDPTESTLWKNASGSPFKA
jgi:hypothetical protein